MCGWVNLRSHLAISFDPIWRSPLTWTDTKMCVWSHYNGWPTQKTWWSHYDGWPTQMQIDGLIMMGDLPKWKMMVSLWRVTYPDANWWSHYDGWPTQMKNKKRSHYNGWPTQLKNKRRSHCYGWPTQENAKIVFKRNGLIVMGDLPRWKNMTYLAKRVGRRSPNKIRLTNDTSWLQSWLEDSSWWHGWFPHFFESFLPARFISFFSHSRT